MIPLGGWADGQLAALANASGAAEMAALTGAALLNERAAHSAFAMAGTVAPGGGCRLLKTLDGAIALNLSRPDDRELLPALLEVVIDGADDAAIAEAVACLPTAPLVTRGREMGLAVAGLNEDRSQASPAVEHSHASRAGTIGSNPRILDLSALWAGPLAGRLLRIAGGEVIKLESSARPDSMRDGNPAFFERLNAEKHQVALDLRTPDGISALKHLIVQSDIVIEAARPRALLQLGIDADRLVSARPGLIWLTITGHGVRGQAANWVAFGDDAGVSGGLSAALLAATGELSLVGDAIADPLTGLFAARTAWDAWRSGQGGRFVFSMSGIVELAIAHEIEHDADRFHRALCAAWGP
jgi:CoA-transferase family III